MDAELSKSPNMHFAAPQAVAPRTLHLYTPSSTTIQVMDADKSTLLYTAHRHHFSSGVEITRPARPDDEKRGPIYGGGADAAVAVGQATFHSLRSDIDLQLLSPGAAALSMRKAGWLSSTYDVAGPGLAWSWERDGALTKDLRLVDRAGHVLARYEKTSFSLSKLGTLTVYGDVPGYVLDAIIVSGLARLEAQRRSSQASNVALAGAVTS